MSQIVVGQSGSKNAKLEIDALLRTRLLVQANSGKGKSWLLRRLAEQLFGKVQVIIIDPEGEFASLREKFGYVLVGRGGETPADPRSAALVAHKLLELRASAVCDLYEMKPASRHEWVQKFLDAMIDAPKNLWHPCIVMVDEAHVYCPEKGAGESVASDAVIGMATRGRKRGFCLVAATQRLGKFRKDAAAEMLNVMIGGTFIDIDRKRAADALGVYGADQHKFFDEIKLMERGNFFALGPAISDERILVRVGPVETSHPEAGSAKHAAEPPPAPEHIAKLLPKLADLPKAAEEKAKTEAELRTEIRSLKAQLRAQPSGKPVEVKVADTRAIERAVKETAAKFAPIVRAFESQSKSLRDMAQRMAALAGVKITLPTIEIPRREIQAKEPQRQTVLSDRPPRVEHSQSNGNSELTGPERKVLRALAELVAIGKTSAPKNMVGGWSGYSPTSGGFANLLGGLRTKGMLDYPGPGLIRLTDEGASSVGQFHAPDRDEVLERIKEICSGPEWKLLSAILETGEQGLTKDALGETTGYSPTSGGFANLLGRMRSKGLIEYPQPGHVCAAEWLFVE